MIDWKKEIAVRLNDLELDSVREAEIAEELAQHLEQQADDIRSSGSSEEEAALAALAELDDMGPLAVELRRIEGPARGEADTFGARRTTMIGSLWHDLRFGLRILAGSPVFTAVAVFTLTLGMGANTVIFSLVNELLFRPLPAVQQPDQLTFLSGSYSYPDFEYIRDRNEVFSGLFAQGGATSLNLNTGGRPEVVEGELVTANFFSVLGVNPAMGRTFLPEEERQPGAHPVAVISHGLWQRRFGSAEDAVGKTIQLNGRQFTIVGVMPAAFIGDEVGKRRDLWVPMMMQPQLSPASGPGGPGVLASRDRVWLNVVGRLKPGVSLEQAQAAIALLQDQIAELNPAQQTGYRGPLVLYRVTGGTDPRERGDFLPMAALLLTVVGMVLLTACANVAGLMLSRAAVRQKEIGIRLALGATRVRLLVQLLMESLPLALAAGAAGLLVASWLNGFLSAMELPGGGEIQLNLHLDRRVLGFALGLSLLTTILCGLAPALQAGRVDIMPTLKDDAPAQGYRRSRLQYFFVVAQVSLSVLLLIGGGLFLRSLEKAQQIDPGFSVDRVLLEPINMSFAGYNEPAGQDVYRRIVERIEAVPGVRSASMVSRVPLGLDRGGAVVAREGFDPSSEDAEVMTGYNVVAARYCETMGIALLQGRDFSTADRADSPAGVIVNQTLAGLLWPDETAIGKRLLVGGTKGDAAEVIGVTRDGKYESLGERPKPYLYRPLAQEYQSAMTLIARTDGDPKALIGTAEEVVREIDPNLAVFSAQTLASFVRASLAPARLAAMLLGIFGLLGLGLAAVGVFSVVAYSASRRTREIGIRIALGAQTSDVTRLVLREGMIPVVIGITIGLAAGVALAQLVASFLYGVTATDPVTFAGVAVLLGGVALLACYVPARRAARVDPTIALRYE